MARPAPSCIMAQGMYLKANGELPCWDDVGEDLILRQLDPEALARGEEAELNGFTSLLEVRRALMEGREPHPGLCHKCAVREHGMPVKELKPSVLEVLHVEPSFLCHLNCPQCIPSKIRKSIKHGPYHLDPAAYDGFLAGLKRDGVKAIRLVIFEGRGDPLNNKQMGELVRLTKQHFPQSNTSITTHGNFPYRPWMLDCGLDMLRLSVDGAFPDSYAKYRVGGRLESAVKLMADVRDAGRAAGRKLHIEWKYILFEWNDSDEELAHASRLAKELEVRLRFVRTHSEGRSLKYTTPESVEEMCATIAPHASPDLTFQLKTDVSHVGVVRSDQVKWMLAFALERLGAGDEAEAYRSLSEAIGLDHGVGSAPAIEDAEGFAAQAVELMGAFALPETPAGLAPLAAALGREALIPALLERYLELAPAAQDVEQVRAELNARRALIAECEGDRAMADSHLAAVIAALAVPADPFSANLGTLLQIQDSGAVAALANLALRRGWTEAAALLFERYLSLAPKAADARQIAHTLERLSSERRARLGSANAGPRSALIERSLPEDPGVAVALANVALQEGRSGEAAELFERYLELAPDAADTAAVLDKLDQLHADEAERERGRIERRLRTAVALQRAGLAAEADRLSGRRVLRREDICEPTDPAAAVAMANLAVDRDDVASAGGFFERYLELAPDAPDAPAILDKLDELHATEAERARERVERRLRIAVLLQQAGREAEADRLSRRGVLHDGGQAAPLAPADPGETVALANLALGRQDLAAAAMLFERYLELAPEAGDAPAVLDMLDRVTAERLLRLAIQMEQAGRADEALALARRALAGDPGPGAVLPELADEVALTGLVSAMRHRSTNQAFTGWLRARGEADAADLCDDWLWMASGQTLGRTRQESLRLRSVTGEQDQAQHADGYAPDREGPVAALLDEAQHGLHHHQAGNEGDDKADGDQPALVKAKRLTALVEVVGEGAGHGGNGQEKGKLRRRSFVPAHHQRAGNGGAGAGDPGDH
jgi:tetratricopeptide (TPR) repeat protein